MAGTTEALDPIFTGLQTALNPQVFSEQVRALRAQDLPDPGIPPQEETLFATKEVVVRTVIGGEYHQYISHTTGDWVSDNFVLEDFYRDFEERIKYLFQVDE